jgi:hypothetical protein
MNTIHQGPAPCQPDREIPDPFADAPLPGEPPELPYGWDCDPEDEAWWAAQSEGGCGPEELSPEERRFWDATLSAMQYFLS